MSCSSCHLSLLFGMLLHHLVSMAIQWEVHQAWEIMASPLFLWITNCLDFGHWIAFNTCYFLLTSELVESLFGVTWGIKSLNLFKTEGAGYPTICSLFCIGLALSWPQLFRFPAGSWSRSCSWVQVWLQLQDLNLHAGFHGLMCLHGVFQHIRIPMSWGPLRFSRICVDFSLIGSHGGRLPCLPCSDLQQWELHYWKVDICANLKEPTRLREENTFELRESMRTVSCADSAFHGKKKLNLTR